VTTPPEKKKDPVSGISPLPVRGGTAVARRKELEEGLPSRGKNSEHDHATAWKSFQMFVLKWLLRLTGLLERGRNNTQMMSLREEEVFEPRLPEALDGVRILHLSDPHFGRTIPEHTDAVCELLRGLDVDLVLMTGDFRYGHLGPSDHAAPAVQRMLAGMHIQHGSYAVLGNHDTIMLAEALEMGGVRVLFNEGVAIDINGATLWLAGADDPYYFRVDDMEASFRGMPPDAFPIALVHSPERATQAAKLGAKLYLCGHTHGGQIRLPWIGSLVTNAESPRSMSLGRWKVGEMTGFTSPGLGTTDLMVRFGCPPEAMVVVLRQQQAPDATDAVD
jgi:uncharacterized protein